MRALYLVSTGIAVSLVAGCQIVFPLTEPPPPPPTTCVVDDDCRDGQIEGRCECGECAFPDAACAISSLRWGASAEELAETCVPAVDQIDAKVFHTCARMSDGTAWCWGFNATGQLGRPQPEGIDANVPVQLRVATGEPMRNVEEIRTSAFATCARFTDGTVGCWGSNEQGQLGAGLPPGPGMGSLDPQQVKDAATDTILTKVTALRMGYHHACALVDNDKLYCWGDSNNGQVGPGTTGGRIEVARQVSGLPSGSTIAQLAAGGEHTCVNVTEPPNLRRTYCWGRTADGRLGANDPTDVDLPREAPKQVLETAVAPLPDAFAIDAGNRHSCTIKTAGFLHCWGSNTHGELGDGTTMPRGLATVIPLPEEPQQVAAGDFHTCAITGDTVHCWGIDSDGQIGDGEDDGADELSPVEIDLGVRQTELTVGHAHTCTVGVDRSLHCWGFGDQGQLGLGDLEPRIAPTEIPRVAFCPSRE